MISRYAFAYISAQTLLNAFLMLLKEPLGQKHFLWQCILIDEATAN